jgi:hypothetical protein
LIERYVVGRRHWWLPGPPVRKELVAAQSINLGEDSLMFSRFGSIGSNSTPQTMLRQVVSDGPATILVNEFDTRSFKRARGEPTSLAAVKRLRGLDRRSRNW